MRRKCYSSIHSTLQTRVTLRPLRNRPEKFVESSIVTEAKNGWRKRQPQGAMQRLITTQSRSPYGGIKDEKSQSYQRASQTYNQIVINLRT